MWNPFADKIVLRATDIITMIGQKEAELMVVRSQLQQALHVIEKLQAQSAPTTPPK